jgi:hypothetical protein
MHQTGVADPNRRNAIMRVFPRFRSCAPLRRNQTVRCASCSITSATMLSTSPTTASGVRLWLAAGTKTFLLRFREKEHEMPSLQPGPGSRSTFLLMSCAAAVQLTSGVSIANWFLRQLDYRRTLHELHGLSERDLRGLRVNQADFSAIAWAEAKRLHELRRGSPLSNGSLGRWLRSPFEHSRPKKL